jgi:hypothetical protein
MPAERLSDPNGIACLFSDGRRVRVLVPGEPAALVADLLTGLVSLVHPHGRVNAPGTAEAYLIGVRSLAAFARARGIVGGAGALTRPGLGEYWMQTDRLREATTRRMLAAADTHSGATLLQPGTRVLVSGRHFTANQKSTPLQPYTDAEWRQIHEVCRAIVDDAYATHRRALAAAARGHDPRQGGWSSDNQRWLMLRLGPCGAERVGVYLGRSTVTVKRRGGVRAACDELFPGVSVVIAYRLLLGMYCGIVPDGLADLGIGDIDWAGKTTVLLSYLKGRTGPESLTLPKRAVRLLEQWLAHSTPIREHAPDEARDSLWLYFAYAGPSANRFSHQPSEPTESEWTRKHGLQRVNRRRIRTTYLSRRQRSTWHGSPRATIDPNHTPAVEGDHYLSATTPAQLDAIETIIEGAQQDMLGRARQPMVLPDASAAELAARYPQLVTDLNLDEPAIDELLGGAQDVFVAACADPLSGLHGPAGKPCPARPWVCLLCPLAVFTPRHAPNLLRLKAFFSRQWDQLPSTHYMAVFGPYATAVVAVLDRYELSVLTAAQHTLNDLHDDEHALPLRPEERTT